MLCKYEHFFLLKTSSLILNWVPLCLFYQHIMPERLSSQSNKIWNQRDLKNPKFSTLVNREKFVSVAKTYIQKIQFSIFFMNWEKMRSPDKATLKKPKISLWVWKNLEVQPKTNTQKIPILNLWTNWENCFNLNFTVENKTGNLHEIRHLTFQT